MAPKVRFLTVAPITAFENPSIDTLSKCEG